MGAAQTRAEAQVIYFAYGSNMDPAQMRERCPGAEARGAGYLAEYRLCFPRWSDRRLHAVASIEPSQGERVWGVLYHMTPEDWRFLHAIEGHLGEGHALNGYDLIAVEVSATVETVAARTYVANVNPKRPDAGLTSARYLRQLIDGAIAHRLPDDYVDMLRAVPTFD